MLGLQIADIKDFTNKLFRQEVFDHFLVPEAAFTTTFSIAIDGSSVSEEGKPVCATWGDLRPLAFQIVKGQTLPKGFKIVLRLNEENTNKTLASCGLSYAPEEVAGLFLNIYYENGQIRCTTGASLTVFSLDKTLEKEWGKVICRFLRHHQIPFEEV